MFKLPIPFRKWLTLTTLWALGLGGVFSCRPDPDYYNPPAIRSTPILAELEKDPNKSLFVEALTRANFRPALGGGAGAYTIFAPTNQAMQEYLTSNNYKSINDVPIVRLNQLLGNHILNNSLLYTYDFQSQKFNPRKDNRYQTLGDKFVTVMYKSPEDFTVNSIKVTSTGAGTGTGNGVLHTIEKVLTPQKSADSLLLTTPTYSEFYKMVNRFYYRIPSPTVQPIPKRDGSGYDTVYVKNTKLSRNLSADNDLYTVFAPTNAAVEEFLKNTPYTSVDQLPEELARLIVDYHVIVPTNNNDYFPPKLVKDFTTGAKFITSYNDTLVVGRDLVASDVAQGDVVLSNGVFHGLNKVLLPPSLLTGLGRTLLDKDLSLFARLAVQIPSNSATSPRELSPYARRLVGLTNPIRVYTVLAPTNEALTKAGFTTASLDALPQADKDRILQSHILNTNTLSTDLKPGTTYNLLVQIDKASKPIVYNANGKFVSDSGAEVSVVKADVRGTLGVLHVIDGVLVTK